MKLLKNLAIAASAIAAAALTPPAARAQTTDFTYEGRLTQINAPANGVYDLTFTLYSALTGLGGTVGTVNVINDIPVDNGRFTVTLNYGAIAFDGNARYLEIAVRPGPSTGAYSTLVPRQPINSAPYAIRALSAGTAATATTASGVAPGAVTSAALAPGSVGTSAITDGSITSADLNAGFSANLALRAGGNAFTGNQTVAGNVGIGTVTPAAKLDVKGPAGTSVRVTGPGGFGNTVAFDLATYDPGAGNGPSARIQATDNNFSGTLELLTKQPGAAANPMVLRLQLNQDGHVNVDPASANDGAILGQPALAFGDGSSGEGIASKRTGGANQWGLDFYTGYQNRMSIANNGNVGIGKISATTALDVNGVVTATGFSGNGANLTGINAANLTGTLPSSALGNVWKVGGNAGTAGGILGTSDSQPMRLFAGNSRALSLETKVATIGPLAITAVNVVGGANVNTLANGVVGATIGGGGSSDFNGFFTVPNPNTVVDLFGTVGGGLNNTAGSADANTSNGRAATVAGGEVNQASGQHSFIGGGQNNSANSDAATVSGGRDNSILADSPGSFIGGGDANTIRAFSAHSTIGGGINNEIEQSVIASTIGGGRANVIKADFEGVNAENTIGGGADNRITGRYSVIPGGSGNNIVGWHSMAAGHNANAYHSGSFVWADNSTTASFASTDANQFSIRAAGGVRLNTETSLTFGNSGSSKLSTDQGGAIELGDSTSLPTTPYIDFHYGSGFPQDYNIRIINEAFDVLKIIRSGSSTPMAEFNPGGLLVNGVIVSASDRNLKENFEPVEARDVLAKVAALPLSRWNYKNGAGTTHLGPMAQDFRAAFGLGYDDKGIAGVDADGVALAAIQGLNEIVREKDTKIRELEKRMEKLERMILRDRPE